uniref:Transposable element P transposase n=1 Tax=Schizaphis graminum TaxID=13262 RepID=A0A2S2PJV8_SCHGA
MFHVLTRGLLGSLLLLFGFQNNYCHFVFFDRLKQLGNDIYQKYSTLLGMQLKLRNIILKQKQCIELIKTTIELQFNQKFNNILNGLFTPTQIQLLLHTKQKPYKWQTEDIASAITLRSLSKKAYIYLRDKKGFPLPGLSTLRHWASTFSVEKGILVEVMNLLKVKGSTLSKNEKLTVISFDETYVTYKLCYDKSNQQVLGPYKCVQTVMARGLTSNWKQPIFYDFDQRMTKTLLLSIITSLHDAGFEVKAAVSDMAPCNESLWSSLGITSDITSFEHPITKSSIHVFADPPHLLKLARNHFLDRGFVLPSGTFKVSEKHINVSGPMRKNVKLAAQFFSNTVANAISYCGKKMYC